MKHKPFGHRMWVKRINTMSMRILTDENAVAEFERAGMPSNPVIAELGGRRAGQFILKYQKEAPEYLEWIDNGGSRAYQLWLLRHPSTFVEAHTELLDRINWSPMSSYALYRPQPPESVMDLERVYNQTLHWILWWPFLLLPAIEFALSRKTSPLSLLAASLVLITYSQAYLGFFGDGIEFDRHMLPALVLYRVTSAVGIAAFVALAFRAAYHRLSLARISSEPQMPVETSSGI